MNNFRDVVAVFEGKTVQGYIWMSDASAPLVFDNEVMVLDLPEEGNPFVWEAMLYCETLNRSLVARYVDGEYVVTEKVLQGQEFSEEMYWPSFRLEKKIRMRQYWRECEDESCEGMKVLVPAELVFVGFC